ncbi:UDP-3-O-(3-hydroxymyristoyl)glucosamine N-acyltransferase [Candidatus Pelagibacter sp.]|nr:UDP-3-O-(3-hydroxymyristoyl)glucosamine N-acyltransferase [Candidatus Pelagibacter sp.]
MKRHTQIKKDININKDQIIEFLKTNNLYKSDNNIDNFITTVCGLEDTMDKSLCWISYKNYNLDNIKSSIVLVNENFLERNKNKSIIVTKDARLAISLIINEFFYERKRIEYISSKATIDKNVKIGDKPIINDFVVIGENCVIGNNVTIYPGVIIEPNTVIYNNVIINSGVKIGQEGFGYINYNHKKNLQFPHIGKVIIKDNVEIGSNTCIDRGALSNTIISENTKINNLCHIAHNNIIGKNCIICSKVNISGSTKIHDNVYIGPNATIIDGVTIGPYSIIGMGGIVRKNVKENSTIVPFESMDKKTYIKTLKKFKS